MSYIIGAVIAVALQTIVAPNISVFNAMPNFILCYAIACAIANAREVDYIMPFVLGLVYDFSGGGPIGAMALTCLAATFLASLLFRIFDNETLFIPIVLTLIVCVISEFAYGLLTIACGLDVGLLDAILYVILPCAAYDMVVSLVIYALVRRFVFRANKPTPMGMIDPKMG